MIAKDGEERTLQVVDANTGRIRTEFQGHSARVWDAMFSVDGRRVLTASADHTAQIWEIADRRLSAQIRYAEKPLEHPVFSSDGRSLLAVTANSAVLFDPQSGRQVRELAGQVGKLAAAAYSPDGRRVVIVGELGAQIWDIESARSIHLWEEKHLLHAVYSPGGGQIALTGRDSDGLLWDAQSGRLLHKLSANRTHLPLIASYSRDGRRIVTSGVDKAARIWDAETGQELPILTRNPHIVTHAMYSPDGHRIVTASTDGTVQIWDAETGHELLNFRVAHDGSVDSAMFSPSADYILTRDFQGIARVWDSGTGRLLSRLGQNYDECLSAVYSPVGRHVVTSHRDGALRLWDTQEEDRSPSLLSDILKCRVPLKFDPGLSAVLPGSVDRDACDRLPLVPSRLSPSEEPGELLRSSILAYLRLDFVTARQLLVQIRRDAASIMDPDTLIEVALTERVFAGLPKDSEQFAIYLAEVSALVRSTYGEPASQAKAFGTLSNFALTVLHLPSVALWLCDEALRRAPADASLTADRLEALLAAGDFKGVLTSAQLVFDMQRLPGTRAVVAALAWTSAQLNGDAQMVRRWAWQVLVAYQQIEPDESAGWDFGGLKYALRQTYPPPFVLDKYLSVFAILERRRNPKTDDSQLSQALGLGSQNRSGHIRDNHATSLH